MTNPASPSPNVFVPRLLLPALLFLGLYLPSLDYDFVWTDQGEIETGLIILPPERISEAFVLPMLYDLETHVPTAKAPYYRPVQVTAVSWIDHRFGRRPRHFRMLNLALGAATSLLVTLLAWRLFSRTDLALIAGALFAAHPANIENYVWIAGLSQAFASFFIAASLLLSISLLESRRVAPGACAGIAALGCLVLALCSKESAAVAPILLLALLINRAQLGLASGDGRKGWILFASQIAVTLFFMIGWRPRVLGALLADSTPLGGSVQLQIATAISNWPRVMNWLLMPMQSNTTDVVPLPGSFFDPRVLAGAALAAISLALWVRLPRRGQGNAALGLAWIWIAFAPTSGLLPLNHLHGERYVSLSLFGLALLVPALLLAIRERAPRRLRNGIVPLLGLLLVVGYGERSWNRIPDWRSDLDLFTSDVQRDPLYREGHFEAAKAHIVAGDLESAKASLETLRGLGKRFQGHTSFLRREDVVDLYCQVNLQHGTARDSIPHFDSLRKDSPEIQGLPGTSLCGARTLAAVGRHPQAEEVFEAIHSLAVAPFSAEAAAELALMAAGRGEQEAARSWLDGLEVRELRDRDLRRRVEALRRDPGVRTEAP